MNIHTIKPIIPNQEKHLFPVGLVMIHIGSRAAAVRIIMHLSRVDLIPETGIIRIGIAIVITHTKTLRVSAMYQLGGPAGFTGIGCTIPTGQTVLRAELYSTEMQQRQLMDSITSISEHLTPPPTINMVERVIHAISDGITIYVMIEQAGIIVRAHFAGLDSTIIVALIPITIRCSNTQRRTIL